MIRKLAALISIAVVFSVSFALSTQSGEAKTSRNGSNRARYFVPPPPPCIPSIIPSALVVTSAQAVIVDDVVVKEAKTSRNNSSRPGNYFVPPPPPYIPSIIPSALVVTNAQAVTADDAVVDKPVNPYNKYIFTRTQSDLPQVVQSNPYVSYHRSVETRILKQIDYFDSEISSREKEIGKLLNL